MITISEFKEQFTLNSLVIFPPQRWEIISNCCDDGREDRELSSKSQGQQHREEQEGPGGRNWKPGHCFWVSYERQPWPWNINKIT